MSGDHAGITATTLTAPNLAICCQRVWSRLGSVGTSAESDFGPDAFPDHFLAARATVAVELILVLQGRRRL
jgi:hypothetical protein